MADAYKAQRTVTAVFKEEDQLDGVVRRLIDRGVPQDHISVMGKNFSLKPELLGSSLKKMLY